MTEQKNRQKQQIKRDSYSDVCKIYGHYMYVNLQERIINILCWKDRCGIYFVYMKCVVKSGVIKIAVKELIRILANAKTRNLHYGNILKSSVSDA